MSKTVSIIAPRGETLAHLVHPLSGRLQWVFNKGGGVSVKDGAEGAYIYLDDAARMEMGETRFRAFVEALGEDPVAFYIGTSYLAVTRRVLELIVDRNDVLVDIEGKHVFKGADFVRRLRAKPTWDWRVDAAAPE